MYLYSPFFAPFGVSRVVCGAHPRLLAAQVTRLLSEWLFWCSPVATAGLLGLIPPKQSSKPPNWNLQRYKSADFCQIVECQGRNAKPPYWKLSGGGSVLVMSQWQHCAWIISCTHPSAPSTRLDRLQVPLFKFSVWPDRESKPAYRLWWRVFNQVHRGITRMLHNFVLGLFLPACLAVGMQSLRKCEAVRKWIAFTLHISRRRRRAPGVYCRICSRGQSWSRRWGHQRWAGPSRRLAWWECSPLERSPQSRRFWKSAFQFDNAIILLRNLALPFHHGRLNKRRNNVYSRSHLLSEDRVELLGYVVLLVVHLLVSKRYDKVGIRLAIWVGRVEVGGTDDVDANQHVDWVVHWQALGHVVSLQTVTLERKEHLCCLVVQHIATALKPPRTHWPFGTSRRHTCNVFSVLRRKSANVPKLGFG